MPYGVPPPPMVPEMVMENMRADEIERREGSADDVDEMRDDAYWSGRGSWLVILLGILGIAVAALLLHFLAGF